MDVTHTKESNEHDMYEIQSDEVQQEQEQKEQQHHEQLNLQKHHSETLTRTAEEIRPPFAIEEYDL